MPKPPISLAPPPAGWDRVMSTDAARLNICSTLIINSTSAPGVAVEGSRSNLAHAIERRRMDLWLKADNLIALGFHSLDGPTTVPGRTPKFCICLGIDPSLRQAEAIQPGNSVYQTISDAVVAFAKSNQASARIYVLIQKGKMPKEGDLVRPFFDYATKHDIAASEGEKSAGVVEDYPDSTKKKKNRWNTPLETWKMRMC